MPKQIEVQVKDISRDDNGQPTELFGTVRILTYKSFIYLNANPENPRYELIGEVDEKGNLVPGNPNLSAQHRQSAPNQRSAEPVVNTGPSAREKQLEAEIERLKASLQGPPAQAQTVSETYETKVEVQEQGKTETQTTNAKTERKNAGRGKKLNTVTEFVA